MTPCWGEKNTTTSEYMNTAYNWTADMSAPRSTKIKQELMNDHNEGIDSFESATFSL